MAQLHAESLDSLLARAELEGFRDRERAHDRRYRSLARRRNVPAEDWEDLADEGSDLYDDFASVVDRIR